MTHISIDFKGLLVSLGACCHGFGPRWPPRCGFPVFIPEAHQEVLKALGHGDVLSPCIR